MTETRSEEEGVFGEELAFGHENEKSHSTQKDSLLGDRASLREASLCSG